MRKLAWFVIIVFGAVLGVAVGCAVSDPFKVAVSSTLNSVGGGILVNLGHGIQTVGNIACANVTNIVISGCSLLIVGGILWIGVHRLYTKDKIPLLHPQQSSQPQYQGQPNYQPPQQIAAPPQQVQAPTPKVEEKKVEAAV